MSNPTPRQHIPGSIYTAPADENESTRDQDGQHQRPKIFEDTNIDPSLIDHNHTSAPALNDTTHDADSTRVNVNAPLSSLSGDLQDVGLLKRTYLSLLPTEQLVDLLLAIDARVDVDTKKTLWPSDLKQAVASAAVAAIVGEGAKDKGLEALKALGIDAPVDARADGTTTISATPPHPSSTNDVVVSDIRPLEETSGPTALIAPAPTMASFQLPPQQQQPSFASPFASGSFPYQQQSTFSPHFYEPPASSPGAGPSQRHEHSVPPPGIPPPNMPPPPPPPPLGFVSGGPPDPEDDLPSYEDMIVQAIVVHSDPNGTAPKQIFQWMASTYPLQTNFRPSASQALQKAFKRGRLEKNPDGRYRLNVAWSGGSTAKRVTRRPQTYSRSVTNPSPSSHPAANVYRFPPHHHAFHYGPGGKSTMGSSPVPPGAAGIANGGEVGAQVHDAELKDSMENAINILQALTAAPLEHEHEHEHATPDLQTQHVANDTQTLEAMVVTASDAVQAATTATTAGAGSKAKAQAKGKSKNAKTGKKGGSTAPIPIPPPIFAAESDIHIRLPTPPPTAASQQGLDVGLGTNSNSGVDDSRTRLQGALALLATQLATIAAETEVETEAETSGGGGSYMMRSGAGDGDDDGDGETTATATMLRLQDDLQAQWETILAPKPSTIRNPKPKPRVT